MAPLHVTADNGRNGKGPDDVRALLPWYVNGTLGGDERKAVEAWLARHPGAQAEVEALRHLHRAVRAQPLQRPPDRVWAQLRARLQAATSPWPRWLTWAWTGLVTFILAFFLWALFQPGIVLRWQAHTSRPAQAHVWRVAEDGRLIPLAALPLPPGQQSATFVDPFVRPGTTYVYRVELVDRAGRVVWWWTVVQRADTQIVGFYVAIGFVSLAFGWMTVTAYVHVWNLSRRRSRPVQRHAPWVHNL